MSIACPWRIDKIMRRLESGTTPRQCLCQVYESKSIGDADLWVVKTPSIEESMHYERAPPGRSRLGVACLGSVANWSGSPWRAAAGQRWCVLPSEKAVVLSWARRMALYLRGAYGCVGFLSLPVFLGQPRGVTRCNIVTSPCPGFRRTCVADKLCFVFLQKQVAGCTKTRITRDFMNSPPQASTVVAERGRSWAGSVRKRDVGLKAA
jgi:hypothetical protein